jgi:hypothetical protein
VQAKQPKRLMTTRVSEEGYAHIQQRAIEADVEISHMVRRMLAYASMHMPKGWVPQR